MSAHELMLHTLCLYCEQWRQQMIRTEPFVSLTRLSAHGNMTTNRQSDQGASQVHVHTEGTSTGISTGTSCAFFVSWNSALSIQVGMNTPKWAISVWKPTSLWTSPAGLPLTISGVQRAQVLCGQTLSPPLPLIYSVRIKGRHSTWLHPCNLKTYRYVNIFIFWLLSPFTAMSP